MLQNHMQDHTDHDKQMHIIEDILQDRESFSNVSEVFKQLGDPSRLRIYWLLCHSEECVMDIANHLEMSSPAVSHHLRVLKSFNLITSIRSGKEVYYKASDTSYSNILHSMIEQVMEITCPQLLDKQL